MNLLADIQARLRERCPSLKAVQGLAEYAALDAAPPVARLPCAFVLSVSDSAEPEALVTGPHRQRMTVVVGVIIVASALRDGRGEAAALELEDLRASARDALMGWRPPDADTALSYVSGELLAARNGTADWQLSFSCRRTLTAGEGLGGGATPQGALPDGVALPAPGAVRRSWTDRANDRIHFHDFVPEEVRGRTHLVDCRPYLQAALDTGRRVFIGEGDVRLDGTVFYAHNQVIEGEAWGTRLFLGPGANCDLLASRDAYELMDMRLTAPAANTGPGGKAIVVLNATSLIVPGYAVGIHLDDPDGNSPVVLVAVVEGVSGLALQLDRPIPAGRTASAGNGVYLYNHAGGVSGGVRNITLDCDAGNQRWVNPTVCRPQGMAAARFATTHVGGWARLDLDGTRVPAWDHPVPTQRRARFRHRVNHYVYFGGADLRGRRFRVTGRRAFGQWSSQIGPLVQEVVEGRSALELAMTVTPFNIIESIEVDGAFDGQVTVGACDGPATISCLVAWAPVTTVQNVIFKGFRGFGMHHGFRAAEGWYDHARQSFEQPTCAGLIDNPNFFSTAPGGMAGGGAGGLWLEGPNDTQVRTITTNFGGGDSLRVGANAPGSNFTGGHFSAAAFGGGPLDQPLPIVAVRVETDSVKFVACAAYGGRRARVLVGGNNFGWHSNLDVFDQQSQQGVGSFHGAGFELGDPESGKFCIAPNIYGVARENRGAALRLSDHRGGSGHVHLRGYNMTSSLPDGGPFAAGTAAFDYPAWRPVDGYLMFGPRAPISIVLLSGGLHRCEGWAEIARDPVTGAVTTNRLRIDPPLPSPAAGAATVWLGIGVSGTPGTDATFGLTSFDVRIGRAIDGTLIAA